MTAERFSRLVFGTIIPIVLGPLLFSLQSIIQSTMDLYSEGSCIDLTCLGVSIASLILMFGMGVFASFFLVGIPALIFSIFIELVINPKIKNDAVFYLLVAILGMVAGIRINMEFIGLLVGITTGFVLRLHFLAATKRMHSE